MFVDLTKSVQWTCVIVSKQYPPAICTHFLGLLCLVFQHKTWMF